jgi:hypothetical protein
MKLFAVVLAAAAELATGARAAPSRGDFRAVQAAISVLPPTVTSLPLNPQLIVFGGFPADDYVNGIASRGPRLNCGTRVVDLSVRSVNRSPGEFYRVEAVLVPAHPLPPDSQCRLEVLEKAGESRYIQLSIGVPAVEPAWRTGFTEDHEPPRWTGNPGVLKKGEKPPIAADSQYCVPDIFVSVPFIDAQSAMLALVEVRKLEEAGGERLVLPVVGGAIGLGLCPRSFRKIQPGGVYEVAITPLDAAGNLSSDRRAVVVDRRTKL